MQYGACKNIKQLAQKIEQPFYLYDLDGILERLEVFKNHFPVSIHYAMKANDHPLILKAFAEKGIGVDIVSGGELDKALDAGFPADKIVFSGVAKSKTEIKKAIENKIKQINVESPQELERIAEIAKSLNAKASVALRMNPDVNPETHPYIKTGFRDNKFGMDASFLPQLENILDRESEHLLLNGLTLHIGSQIRDVKPFLDSVIKTIPIYEQLKEKYKTLTTFDVGGGVGMDYDKEESSHEVELLKEYGESVRKLLEPLGCEILCEPGRILVGRYGLLVGEVQYIKETPYKRFAIVNVGMHHLMRPALYQAFHRILPVEPDPNSADKLYDIVGPICESADVLGFERMLPELKQGDYVAVADVGAYGAVMSSQYNSHEAPIEVVSYQGELKTTEGESYS